METMKNDMNDDRLDFGEDADVVPQADAAFDAWIAKVAPSLNTPRAAPRHEMWNAIQAARKTADDAQAGRLPGVIPLRRNPWRLMSLIAAALLLGVAIDRIVLRPAGDVTQRADVAPAPSDSIGSNDPARLYRMAAAQTLTQAEALLTAYRASGGSAGAGAANRETSRQLGRWGRDILSSTRLLIDSPAGADPQFRALLSDLELVLVQIIELSGTPLDASDRRLIDRAMEDRDLLLRIRTAVPAGAASAADAASDD
jgi:hypothetical protein